MIKTKICLCLWLTMLVSSPLIAYQTTIECDPNYTEEDLELIDCLPCVVFRSPYHLQKTKYEQPYQYGDSDSGSVNNQLEILRRDYMINNRVIRFEGYLKPPGNPQANPERREKEILDYLSTIINNIKAVEPNDEDVVAAVDLTADAASMHSQYRLAFVDNKYCPNAYLTDRVECIGQMIGRYLGLKDIGRCRGMDNL